MVWTWRPATSSPEAVRSLYGAVVAHGQVAYFSTPDSHLILTFTLPDYRWGVLPQRCSHSCTGLAVVNDKLTAVGGTTDKNNRDSVTNTLFSLSEKWLGKRWKDILPPMPTKRMCPATVTSSAHLVVAGGSQSIYHNKLDIVEVMNTDTLEWFQAFHLPLPVRYPQMRSCGDYVFLCEDNTTFSCSLNELLIKSCKPGSINNGVSVWTKRANIPAMYAPSLATVKGQVLAVGGKTADDKSTAEVYRYDRSADKWEVVSHMLTPRSRVLAVALASNELMVVGGVYGEHCMTTEIGECFSSNF